MREAAVDFGRGRSGPSIDTHEFKGIQGMTRYVGLLREHWALHRPREWAAMSDREEVLQLSSEAIEREVLNLSMQIEGPDPKGEEYLEKVARLMSARTDAESDVLHELLPPQEDDPDYAGQPLRLDQVRARWMIEKQAEHEAQEEADRHDLPPREAEALYSKLLEQKLLALDDA